MNFKLQGIKPFGNPENLYGNFKKYRRVFDVSECRYLYSEIALYNLQFTREAWKANARIVCRNHKTGEQVCELKKEIDVTPDLNIFYVREGWGTPEPGWWKKGIYKWEAYLNEQYLGEAYFYIVDKGQVTPHLNPYFDINSARLFEGPKEPVPVPQRVYLQGFAQAKTRYISIEMNLLLKNHDSEVGIPLDFQVNVFNDSGQHKAYIEYFQHIVDGRTSHIWDTGYGTDTPSFWVEDNYRLEVLFMDTIVSTINFQVGSQDVALLQNQDTVPGGNFKFQSLKVFSSTENLYRNFRKYRRVFDESESRYLYAEIALFNKLFDERPWRLNAEITCTKTANNEQLCKINKDIDVPSDQNIVYIREGWGTPDAGWWKQGTYFWEAFIDGQNMGKVEFHITNRGLPSPSNNPYFSINYIKLFESPKEGTPLGSRKYLKTFARERTRYINIEMQITLTNPGTVGIPLEFQFNFYNDAGQHKAYMEYFVMGTEAAPTLIVDTGYGSDYGSYWFDDQYTLEVLFMDQIIAVTPFTVGTDEVEQTGDSNFVADRILANPVVSTGPLELTFEEAVASLDALIGLDAVKKEIHEFSSYLKFLQVRKEQGFDEKQKFNLNMIFTGNPGTGKTTVAMMMGNIFKSLGLLSKGHVHEVGRAELVAEYIGQTAPKVKKAIEAARGGILFVDEAYALAVRGDDGRDFGREVIEVLLKEMSDGPGDISIIFAGYPREMQHFTNSNPGMASRISRYIHFPDYTPEDLMQIANFSSAKSGVTLSEGAKELLYKKVVEAYRTRTDHFGNARFVNGVVEEAKQNMALRVMKNNTDLSALSKETLANIEQEDIEKAFGMDTAQKVHLPIDEALLQDSLAQLRDLIGMSSIKKEVDEMVKLVRYYREIGKNVNRVFSLHTVLTGNPGTGKTTVARILVRIYKALGILERGHLVEVDAEKLIAPHIGGTSIKTSELIDKSIGGGLFIDEAYSLAMGGDAVYGQEAIETLLKRMEDQRGEFMVIVAGYPKEMQIFLEANPGLMSRFDKHFNFEDYTGEDLIKIADTMFMEEGLNIEESAREYLARYFNSLLDNKHKYFGNARTVRKIVGEVVRNQNLRLASTPASERTPELIKGVTLQDLQDFKLIEQSSSFNRPGIGFR